MASSSIEPRLRLGLIIPSSNRLTEPQFHRYAPHGVDIHVTRLRMTGTFVAPIEALMPRIIEAAEMLADARCDIIGFHCTATSMEEGVAGDRHIIDAIADATDHTATSTATAVLAALQAVNAQRIALVTPYVEATHRTEVDFLTEAGFDVARDHNLGLTGSDAYISVEPDTWTEQTTAQRDDTLDAYMLGCTNIRSIEVIDELESALDRPVITSNQAMLWQSLRLGGLTDRLPNLGRLFHL
jgi:maleate isomerase